jgi:hypothetical protein
MDGVTYVVHVRLLWGAMHLMVLVLGVTLPPGMLPGFSSVVQSFETDF